MDANRYDIIIQSIKRGKLDIAFKDLNSSISGKNTKALNLLETRYLKYKSDKIRGVTKDDTELNNVNSSLLNLINAEQKGESLDISNPNSNIYNITIMRDNYNVGQAAAVGPGSSSSNSTFIQQNNVLPDNFDYMKLSAELMELKANLIPQATLPEHFQAIGELASAEIAAKEKNGTGVINHLKSAGKWVFDFATKVGTSVVADLIKEHMK